MFPIMLLIRGICIGMTVLIGSFFATWAIENHGLGIVFLIFAVMLPAGYLQWRWNRKTK